VFLSLSVAMALAACATTGPPIIAPVTSGSTLRLQQAFAELPNGSYIDLQHGLIIAEGNLDRWTTYCRLYVYDHTRGAEHVVALTPASFAIDSVRMGYRSSDFPEWPGPGFGHYSTVFIDLPAYYLYRVKMSLDSPDQPEVRSLDCYKKWATPHANQYPTLEEIREALGDLIKIELPTSTN
jgi:hypothetical protein